MTYDVEWKGRGREGGSLLAEGKGDILSGCGRFSRKTGKGGRGCKGVGAGMAARCARVETAPTLRYERRGAAKEPPGAWARGGSNRRKKTNQRQMQTTGKQ